jgi:hypothetical protein
MPSGIGRWDYLAAQKPQLLQEYVLDQVASRLAEELRAFPPLLIWDDEREHARFAEVLARPGPLEPGTLRVGLLLTRLELQHEIEASDAFLRSPEAAALLPTPLEEKRALFVCRFLTEALLEFRDFAQGKFKRKDLLALLDRLGPLLLQTA